MCTTRQGTVCHERQGHRASTEGAWRFSVSFSPESAVKALFLLKTRGSALLMPYNKGINVRAYMVKRRDRKIGYRRGTPADMTRLPENMREHQPA